MSSYKWRPQEEHLLQMLLPTCGAKEISEHIKHRHSRNVVGFPCERSPAAVSKKCKRESWTAKSCESYSVESQPETKRWAKIKAISQGYKLSQNVSRAGLVKDASTKILCLSDMHFPLAQEQMIQDAIEAHRDADILVLNGDLLEGYLFSTFQKSRGIAALHEYITVFEFVQMVRSIFKRVVIVSGNHDRRAARALKSAGFDKDSSQVFRPDLLARIANGEELDSTGHLVQKHAFENVFYDQRESWFVKIGKTIFMHPSGRGGAAPGFTVNRHADQMMLRYSREDVDSFVCGHTHKIYKGVRSGLLMIEQGCLTDLAHYGWKAKLDFIGNGANGYAVVYQDKDGNTDFNKSGPIYLGECLPPKKAAI